MTQITVDLDDGQGIQLMDKSALEGPFFHVLDNAHEHTVATEYRLDGKVVHRSVHVQLKEGLGIEAFLGKLSG
jgi:hypothetical protein